MENTVTEEKLNCVEVVDSMDFCNGENLLSVRLMRRPNRSHSVQIFMNGETEIRNVTYNGAKGALAYWNLLKGSLK